MPTWMFATLSNVSLDCLLECLHNPMKQQGVVILGLDLVEVEHVEDVSKDGSTPGWWHRIEG